MAEIFLGDYEDKKPFEKIKGYVLEEFLSESELHFRMEEIRKENTNEVHGFTLEKDGLIGFYYQIGDSDVMGEFPQGIDNSWHSHPDTGASEVLFDEEHLPVEVPENLKILARKLAQSYAETDEVSPEKISLMDIIDIASQDRQKDLISLPGGLLEIRSEASRNGSVFHSYGIEVNKKWQILAIQAQSKITEENLLELRTTMILEYYNFAIEQFKNILRNMGYERMDQSNFLEILEKMGVIYDFEKNV